MRKVYIITQNDLVYYPPMQTLINLMLKMEIEVTFVGTFSDEKSRKEFEKLGVSFEDITLDETGNALQKIIRKKYYTKQIKEFLNKSRIKDEDLIWYVYSGATVCSLYKLLRNYHYIVHFYEFFKSIHSWRYKLLYPSYDLGAFLSKAKAVVHCEYNRAQICRALYGLKQMPYVIPNKPYVEIDKLNNIPTDINVQLNDFKQNIVGKRLIIYQGYFNAKERRLEEFCQSINLLPNEYVLVIMGRGSSYFDALKERYESNRIIFIPFIRPPYHLLFTQNASYGILTYYPQQKTYPGVINPLYCAPNKIYEYGMFGIPMLGNDIPGLKYPFKEFNCGEVLTYPITPQKIADCIMLMENEYQKYSEGAKALNESVNIESVISEILNSI
ncbi:glycosyltransferase family protein [Segatella albensis]|uniref:hypothetical protein n=1 Tax=Segatella albensis TaxID=77768 RepID=UPI00040C6162|nr:hypothetical protein [Segatella albensis]